MAEEKDLNETSEETKEATAEEAENKEAEATETEAPEAEAAEPEEDKKDKKKKADKKLDELKDKIKDLEDARLRQMAEFQNFRTRSEKEKSQMFDMGASTVLTKILPIVDNFERGLQTVPEEEKDSAFANGMNLIYKQLLTELDNLGVKPMDAKGKEFNPDLHNAVMQVETEEFEAGTVVEELQKGYMYKDTVLRHAMVSVAQ